MPAKSSRRGTIKTFFSYKGGVGRTMAVANVGFLAALAGKKVLLMDWDLEAPGLAVYFRGVTDHGAANEIRKAPGVLDLFVGWKEELQTSSGKHDVQEVLERYQGGEPFRRCTRPLVAARHLPKGASLDHIGAGAPLIGISNPISYAEALSTFNWPAFFADYAGGAMLEALKGWARAYYDLILVDSRTGLADVAGICTMQLPDEAVLCFVLNRQNTEGVADIAASILENRGQAISIRLAPMRVSKERPAEEADARARARREMRNAGLDLEAVDHDMAKLSIGAASNVPFYETLAPFAATSASADPLTFDYLRLTQELVDRTVEVPVLDPSWIESVRRRLQPRMTTVEYLQGLETADPDRAFAELDRYLEGALDADPTRELDPEYVETLVEMAMDTGDWMWSGEPPAKIRTVAEKAVMLLHQLHRMSDIDWRMQLVGAMDDFARRWPTGSKQRRTSEYVERDAILQEGDQTVSIMVMRAWLRSNAATSLGYGGNMKEAERAFNDALTLLDNFSGPVQTDDADRLAAAYADILAERARLLTAVDPNASIIDLWSHVLEKAKGPKGYRRYSLAAEALFQIATSSKDKDAAAEKILESVKVWPSYITREAEKLSRAIDVVLATSEPARYAGRFADAAFGSLRSKTPLLRFVSGNDLGQLHDLVEHLTNLVAMMERGLRHKRAVAGLVELLERRILRQLPATNSQQRDEGVQASLFDAFYSLLVALEAAGADPADIAGLHERASMLRQRTLRS